MILQENNAHIAIPAERKKRIMEYIKVNGSAQIKELSVVFAVSEATVRRDLAELDDEGRIERTHGGAILHSSGAAAEPFFALDRTGLLAREEKAIAQYAASLVQDGESIYLDAGPITYQLAQMLAGHRSLSLVTNDLRIAGSLVFHHTTSVIVTGGNKKGDSTVLTGVTAASFLRTIHVDKCFLSAEAIELDYGVSDMDFLSANVKKLAAEAGGRVFVLADHTRFGKTMFAKVCEMSNVDLVVSDKGLDEIYTRRMDNCKIEYYLA